MRIVDWTARTYKVNTIHNYSFLTTIVRIYGVQHGIRKHSDDKLKCIQICKKKQKKKVSKKRVLMYSIGVWSVVFFSTEHLKWKTLKHNIVQYYLMLFLVVSSISKPKSLSNGYCIDNTNYKCTNVLFGST